MIVVQLAGRLGNQLFQYAAARTLALKLGVPLGLDTRGYEISKQNGARPTTETPQLLAFPLQITRVDNATLPRLKKTLIQKVLRLTDHSRYSIYIEPKHGFDQKFSDLPDWTYLTGFFQNERYFLESERQIRTELTSSRFLNEKQKEFLCNIKSSLSVSVHIRRGDYIGDPRYDILSLEYYKNAVFYIKQRISDAPVFFIFSDDPEWARAKVNFGPRTVYAGSEHTAEQDLILMSHCRHHIIANSSFSWWAAWLRPASSKIVVAPREWARIPGVNTSQVVPSSWTRL